ncbi:MAG: aspartate dehydrogenase domain-containing protein [Burkholderiales bacterium]
MRVGIAGFGNVGRDVAKRLAAGAIPGVTVTAVSARDLGKARAATSLPVVSIAELPAHCDVIVEAATADALPEIALAALGAGTLLTIVSAAGLLQFPEIAEYAHAHRGRVRICSGALPGLDILRSAREGGIRSVRLKSRLKPGSMAHEPYVLERGLDLTQQLAAPFKIFSGTAAEAGRAFPRHFNVAIALSFAGIGLDRTEVEVWVEDGLPGAIHRVMVEAEDIALDMESRNKPSENPRTSRIVAPSIIATLRALDAPLVVGN